MNQKRESKLKTREHAALTNTYPDLTVEVGEETLGAEKAHGQKHVCFISNAKMESCLSRNPIEQEGVEKLKDNVNPHLRVTVNPDLPEDVQTRIKSILERHKAAFQTTASTGLCKPLSVKPVKFQLMEGVKLPKVPQQRFKPATEKLSRHLTKCHVK